MDKLHEHLCRKCGTFYWLDSILKPVHLSAIALTLFSISLFLKVAENSRHGRKSNHLLQGNKPHKVKLAELFVLLTNVPILLLFALYVTQIWDISGSLENLKSSWIGPIITLFAVLLYSISVFQLGKSWRVGIEMKANNPFIQKGLYRRSRHPAYGSFILLHGGIVLTLFHFMTVVLAITSVVSLVFLAKQEENDLLAQYPEEYQQYQKQVGFLFPKITKNSLNEKSTEIR